MRGLSDDPDPVRLPVPSARYCLRHITVERGGRRHRRRDAYRRSLARAAGSILWSVVVLPQPDRRGGKWRASGRWTSETRFRRRPSPSRLPRSDTRPFVMTRECFFSPSTRRTGAASFLLSPPQFFVWPFADGNARGFSCRIDRRLSGNRAAKPTSSGRSQSAGGWPAIEYTARCHLHARPESAVLGVYDETYD